MNSDLDFGMRRARDDNITKEKRRRMREELILADDVILDDALDGVKRIVHAPGGLDLYYDGGFMTPDQIAQLRAELELLEFVPSATEMYGKLMIGSNCYRWCSSLPEACYVFSRSHRSPLRPEAIPPHVSELLDLAWNRAVECCGDRLLGQKPNSVLLNWYPDGNAGLSDHSDNDAWLGTEFSVLSISIGAERPIVFKYRQDKKMRPVVTLSMRSGSFLIMSSRETQLNYHHGVPKRKGVAEARFNLTFRYVDPALIDAHLKGCGYDPEKYKEGLAAVAKEARRPGDVYRG